MSINSLCGNGMQTVSKAAAPTMMREQITPRLLYLASTRSQGGIERHSVELAEALREQGARLHYACPPGSHLETWCRERGIPTLPFHLRNSGDLSAAFRLAALIRQESIEIVHAHSRRDYVIAVLGVALSHRISRRRPRLILHAHMVRPLGSPSRLSGRFFAWGADAVVAVSRAVRDRLLHEHTFVNPARVHLIPNGINLAEFTCPDTPESLRQRTKARRLWGLPEEATVLGMIGRLDAKGQKTLLDVLPALSARHPDLHVVLIGSEGQPGDKQRLTAQSEAGGFADRLLLTGPREDVPALLPGLDILVHLPDDESFGLALAEAMAAGLPTVATSIGGCREVVQGGITGLLVPPNDPEALTEALLSLLAPEDGKARRASLGREGRRVVEAEFTQERQVGRLLDLYRELCPVTPPR